MIPFQLGGAWGHTYDHAWVGNCIISVWHSAASLLFTPSPVGIQQLEREKVKKKNMSHVAGLLASAVVSAVGNKLGSAIGDEVTMQWSFKDDLKDMKDTLEYMEAALKDAERRSVSEELVRLWLKRLKNAAYDISYMLDEFQVNSEPASRKVYNAALALSQSVFC